MEINDPQMSTQKSSITVLIPSGTVLAFDQATAPAGWTQIGICEITQYILARKD